MSEPHMMGCWNSVVGWFEACLAVVCVSGWAGEVEEWGEKGSVGCNRYYEIRSDFVVAKGKWEMIAGIMPWVSCPGCVNEDDDGLDIVFRGSVHRTAKKCRIELNQNIVWSIFWLWLPKFGAIPVASCQVSKIF